MRIYDFENELIATISKSTTLITKKHYVDGRFWCWNVYASDALVDSFDSKFQAENLIAELQHAIKSSDPAYCLPYDARVSLFKRLKNKCYLYDAWSYGIACSRNCADDLNLLPVSNKRPIGALVLLSVVFHYFKFFFVSSLVLGHLCEPLAIFYVLSLHGRIIFSVSLIHHLFCPFCVINRTFGFVCLHVGLNIIIVHF